MWQTLHSSALKFTGPESPDGFVDHAVLSSMIGWAYAIFALVELLSLSLICMPSPCCSLDLFGVFRGADYS